MHRVSRQEGGFAMLTTIMIMVACAALALAAYTAASSDIPVSRQDQGRKQALDAAQAGVAWYAAKLKADPDYWIKCAAVPNPGGGTDRAPISATPLRPGQADTRTWRPTSPGSSQAYTVELLPASGPSCLVTDPAGTMLAENRLRIRVTGRSSATRGQKRTLVATFRRPSFLDFVYYTDYEVTDPDADADAATSLSNCGKYYRTTRPSVCKEIQWGSNDKVLGPLHTNDQLNLCGNPTFGRADRRDRIEVTDPVGTRTSCTSNATFNGLKLFGIDPVQLPATDSSLATVPGAKIFAGNTQLHLGTGGYWTRNATNYPNWAWQTYPASKLIYVAGTSGGACTPTTIYSKYDFSDLACGNVYVSGTYDTSLTIAAQNDVVITGDVKRAGTTELLGLIGENYVRVFHPATFASGATTCDTSAANGTDTNPSIKSLPNGGSLRIPWTNPVIQAGILAVNHSFIVDNYGCGSPLGTLNVTGAIAQKFRGPVALFNSGNQTQLTGYTKNYVYDDLLSYREPPNFLDPVKAAWIASRTVEQTPAS